MSEFPSLPPPDYKPSKLVSLLDCKGLALREAEYNKWVSHHCPEVGSKAMVNVSKISFLLQLMEETHAPPHPIPLGMRDIDLDDDLGMDLDEDESLDESVEEERSPPDSDGSDWQLPGAELLDDIAPLYDGTSNPSVDLQG